MTDSVVGSEVGVSTIDGGPELVQLLTPEGERVEHPDYSHYVADLQPEELRGLYRDLVLVRRVDAEATALQRQGELGIWASLLGQEAAQVGSGRAMRAAGLRVPDLPRARRRLVPRRRPAQPARPVPRRQPRRLGPEREELPPLHDRHRRADAARDRLRDGHPARRRGRHRRARARRRRHRLLRRRRDRQGDVNEAFVFASVHNAPVVFFCQNNQWAISEPIERQTRIPLYQRAAGFGFPGVRVDGNDVLAVLRGDQGRAGPRARGQRPDAHRGVHLPDGRAHDLRRPDPLPARRRGRGRGRSGPDRAAAAYLVAQRHGRRGLLRPRSTPSPTSWPRTSGRAASSMPDPEPLVDVRPRLRRRHPLVDEERAAVRRRTSSRSRMPARGRALRWRQITPRQGHQHRPAQGAWRPTRRSSSWARTSASSAASSGSPTGCRRTSARTASSTPRSPSPASSAPRSAWRCAATGRSARSSSTASSTRRSTRSSASWPRCTPARSARSGCRSSSGSRSAAASARSSTTASPPRRTSRTPRA